MSSLKSYAEGIDTSFAKGYKSFDNDITMFALLMESASWFPLHCYCFSAGFDDKDDWFSDVFGS